MKIETGVMVMKGGKAWGVLNRDGRSTHEGWVNPEDAEIHDPKYCRCPEDVTYADSPYLKELASAKLVEVRRTTSVEIVA